MIGYGKMRKIGDKLHLYHQSSTSIRIGALTGRRCRSGLSAADVGWPKRLSWPWVNVGHPCPTLCRPDNLSPEWTLRRLQQGLRYCTRLLRTRLKCISMLIKS